MKAHFPKVRYPTPQFVCNKRAFRFPVYAVVARYARTSLVNACVSDAYKDGPIDDDGVIVDMVLIGNLFDSVPGSCPVRSVIISDDVITLNVKLQAGQAGLRLWFLLRRVLHFEKTCFLSYNLSKDIARNTRSCRLTVVGVKLYFFTFL